MTSRDHAALAALAATQQGCYHRRQAASSGLHWRAIDREVATGRSVAVHRDVFRVAAVPTTTTSKLWAAHLAVAGSVVSHAAAAEVLGLEGLRRGRVTLLVAHGRRHDLPGVRIHQTRDPWPVEHVSVAGLPVTTPRRLLVDVAATTHPASYRHLCADAFVKRLTTPDAVGELARDLARRGKRGMPRVGSMLDEFVGTPPSQSHLEQRLHDLVAGAGLPPLRRQTPLPGRGPVRGCVDGSWDDVLGLIELDGRRWHARMQQIRLDRERDGQAAEAGYVTVRLTYEHVESDPAGAIERLRRVRAVRLRQLRSA